MKELPIMPTGPGHRLDTHRMHTISVDYDIQQMPVFLPLCNAFKVEIDVHFTSLFTVTKSHKEELDTVLFIFEVGVP